MDYKTNASSEAPYYWTKLRAITLNVLLLFFTVVYMYVLQSDTFTHILLSLHGVHDEIMEVNRRVFSVIVVLK